MSQEQLVSPPNDQPIIGLRPSGRGSNKKALKVAGLTVLAALLIAGQAFTAFTVYKHSEKLSLLERRSDRLQEITVRARANRTPMKMAVPMSSLSMMAVDVSDEKVESTPPKANRTPMKMAVPMSSLSMMAVGVSDEKVESTPKAPLSKCQEEAAGLVPVSLPSYKPKCDEHGAYEPEQCWQGELTCWCVDKNGAAVPDSVVAGRAQCNGTKI